MSEEIEVGGVWYVQALSNGEGYEVDDDGSLSGYLMSRFCYKVDDNTYQDSDYMYIRC